MHCLILQSFSTKLKNKYSFMKLPSLRLHLRVSIWQTDREIHINHQVYVAFRIPNYNSLTHMPMRMLKVNAKYSFPIWVQWCHIFIVTKSHISYQHIGSKWDYWWSRMVVLIDVNYANPMMIISSIVKQIRNLTCNKETILPFPSKEHFWKKLKFVSPWIYLLQEFSIKERKVEKNTVYCFIS